MKSPGVIAFSVFGFDIRWYGILIAAAIVIAIALVSKRAPRHGIESDRILDFALITIPMAIIGARLYYVIFNWSYYSGDILKIINLRGGGLAIHGGLIFGIITGVVLCKKWRIDPLNGLDLAVPAIALGQSIGRWGNFFNEEAYGPPTTLPWGLDINGTMVHPTFLYESVWTFLLFLFLSYVDKRRKFNGQVLLLYCILYSLERFFVEGLRTDSLMIGGLKMAQMLSVTVFVVSIVFYFILNRRAKTTDKEEELRRKIKW